MLVRSRHRFTTDEFYRMAETGLIKPGARVELLDGQIMDMMPIGPFHAGTVKRLNRLLASQSKGRWLVAIQDPVRLGPHSEPQPDAMLLRPAADDYISRHPVPEDVFLLIEVADNTVESDRTDKLPLYSRARIREVWLVNLPEQAIEVFREPHDLGYASRTVLKSGDNAQPLAFPDVAIDVKSLLQQVS